MKKFLCFIALASLGSSAFAQTLDEIKKLVAKPDYTAAKTGIDKFLADEKNASKPEAWYYKGVIYNEISKSDATANLCTNCKMEAFAAFKKYQALDAKNIYMAIENNVRLFDLYNGLFDVGSKFYSNKDYIKAYENFNNASELEEYIKAKGFEYNGFKFSKVDTSLVQNIALAARLAQKDDLAAANYQKLVDINVSGDVYLEMYQYLVEYYSKTKNKAALEATLTKAKSFYPTDAYWVEVELDQVDSKDKKALFAKYDELLPKNPTNYLLAYNYSVELFNYTYVGDNRPADFATIKPKLSAVIKSAIALKSTPEVNLLMARNVYNDVYDLQDAMAKIKGTKPEDVKKRTETKAAMIKMADECIKYAEFATNEYAKLKTLKNRERVDYKNAYSIIESMYTLKGDMPKSADAKKKGDAL